VEGLIIGKKFHKTDLKIIYSTKIHIYFNTAILRIRKIVNVPIKRFKVSDLSFYLLTNFVIFFCYFFFNLEFVHNFKNRENKK